MYVLNINSLILTQFINTINVTVKAAQKHLMTTLQLMTTLATTTTVMRIVVAATQMVMELVSWIWS
jgi:hypothetical protein